MPSSGPRRAAQPGRTGGFAPARARACAYAVLRRVFEQGAYADLALRSQARDLDARDRALAMRLAYGAVQRRGTLDHLIERLAERPVGKLDAPLLAALRLGLYELLYLGGAPDHAVVADAVELAKAARAGHGLVNAVLRRATREGAALLAELDDATPERAAVKHSHPEWIARLWWEELGTDDARALLAFDNEPGELALRVNTLVAEPATVAAQLSAGLATDAAQLSADPATDAAQLSADPATVAAQLSADLASVTAQLSADPALRGEEEQRPVALRGDPGIPEALVLEGPWDVHGSPQWRAGAVLAQSRAAMLPARALAPEPGERVLDLCAAPGGKSTHLAALMEGRGEVVAVERNRRRAAELQRTVERLRAQGSVRVVLGDAARPLEGEAPFDRVLVDPPCSGLGTLQARADLRWRVTPKDVTQLARIQAGILAAGAAAVRPGGVLVYSTCTISPTENQHQISAFLESNPDFALEDLGAELPGLRQGRCVLTLPHRDRTAGFFIARLRRG
jgi:16S rRNA (cytosine967-C5)-methyltransferase